MDKGMVVDLEKGTEDSKSAPADAQLPAMAATGGENEPLISDLRRLPMHVEWGELAGKMNPAQKKWLAYWLLVAAASVIILSDQPFHPEVAMFVVVLYAICVMLRAMKQMM
ncbi:unnamed protein product [Urochloa humidicola]